MTILIAQTKEVGVTLIKLILQLNYFASMRHSAIKSASAA
jgi:hypothetical protein